MREERFAKGADGTSLFYEKQGDGPAMVLCDGLMCEGYIWKYLVPAFENDHQILHWHYPGHGRSAEPPRFSDVSPARLSDDLAAVAKDAGLGRVTVVGHSLGVQVGLETCRRHPDLVEALILICGSPGNIVRDFHESALLGYLVPLLEVMGCFAPKLFSAVWKRIPVEPVVWMSMRMGEVNPRLIRSSDLAQYLGRVNRVDFGLALRMLESAGRHDATPHLGEIEAPVLVIAGQMDRFTPPGRSELMAKSIRGAELMMVPSGTHTLPVEQPELVNLRIRRFLAERLGRVQSRQTTMF